MAAQPCSRYTPCIYRVSLGATAPPGLPNPLAMTRTPLSFKLGTVAGSTSSGAGKKGTVSAQGFRVACSLLSGAGALMAAIPSEAAIVYSGKKNVSVYLPATDTGEGSEVSAFSDLGVGDVPVGFGWIGYADTGNAPFLITPLSIAVGDPSIPTENGSKSQLAYYSAGESIGQTGNYKTPEDLGAPYSGGTFFLHGFDITNEDDENEPRDFFTDWQLGSTGFVGFSSDPTSDESIYGWIRFSMPSNLEAGAPITLIDWAYESEPNTPILAGDGIVSTPAPLPALGAAAALAASRRLRRRVKQAQAAGSAVSAIDQQTV